MRAKRVESVAERGTTVRRGKGKGREKNEGKDMEQWTEWNFKRLAYINLSHNDPRRDAPGIISVERGHHAACRPLGRENAARKKQHSVFVRY